MNPHRYRSPFAEPPPYAIWPPAPPPLRKLPSVRRSLLPGAVAAAARCRPRSFPPSRCVPPPPDGVRVENFSTWPDKSHASTPETDQTTQRETSPEEFPDY
ncbi:hypothetical protein Zmor_009942 [Zophobas morio]|uniref:Uncharacterized protein n=1 Tax=Zophobas morio TaxID=2755281 RepID=A0AA38IJQ2_9CUCU|nr:hypothetical protein Zmor_009942 [Zophobas morio]